MRKLALGFFNLEEENSAARHMRREREHKMVRGRWVSGYRHRRRERGFKRIGA